MANIRNFVIIAHIDHGKSTLADRFLEITETVPKEKMQPQFLDRNPLERERGITIKLAPVRMNYNLRSVTYTLNLIDTPGHVDFSYEVSRSLAAVEGAILLVDATTGIQAQTLANLDLAQKQGLKIIPVINKIDLANAEVEKVSQELSSLFQNSPPTSHLSPLKCSAKTGQGVEEVLKTVISQTPPPQIKVGQLKALIFDSLYDPYRGVVVMVRIFQGKISKNQKIYFFQTKTQTQALEVGIFGPDLRSKEELFAGEIGYIITSLKDISKAKVGDTITLANLTPTTYILQPLLGYQEPKSMVFAEIYPQSGEDFEDLRKAVEQLKLNDASFTFQPSRTLAFGAGFRGGFLGMLHLEIVKERLEREYGQNLVVTAPQVEYQEGREPWIRLEIITPPNFLGPISQELQQRRAKMVETKTLGDRLILIFEAPLSEIIVDFYDQLKSISSGYASMNYELIGYRPADLVKLDILIAGEKVEPFSQIVHKDKVQKKAREFVEKLKNLIPRQLFEVKIQAAVGGKILASESIPPLRKDVIAKLYGGDVTRKRKLLEKQKAGKKRMRKFGSVEIPSEVFLKVLK